jgi:hypothetical protein
MSLFPAYFNRYRLVVDKTYLLASGKKIKEAKLVRITEKGFNFEDVKNRKCFFKKHLYPTEIVRNGMTEFTFYIIKGITIDTK